MCSVTHLGIESKVGYLSHCFIFLNIFLLFRLNKKLLPKTLHIKLYLSSGTLMLFIEHSEPEIMGKGMKKHIQITTFVQ